MPKFRVENLIERPRKIGIVRAEPEEMVALIPDNVRIPTELDQSSSWQRGITFLAWMRRESGELTVGSKETRSPQFPIDWIIEIIDEADAIIVFGRGWNQRRIWNNELSGVLGVEIFTNYNTVPVTIERSMKSKITVIRRIEYQIKHHQAGVGVKQSIQQQGPYLTRPRKTAFGH